MEEIYLYRRILLPRWKERLQQSHLFPTIRSLHGNAHGVLCRESAQSYLLGEKNVYHMPFLLSISEVGLERNARSWASILKMRTLMGKATLHSEPSSQDIGSEIKNKLCLQKLIQGKFLSLRSPSFAQTQGTHYSQYSRAEFLNVGITSIWDWITLCGGGCPMHCRMYSSTPSLWWQTLHPLLWQSEISLDIANVP